MISVDGRKYLNTYAGNRLLEKHNLSDSGIWLIRGEDPNCDLAGSHVEPELGTFDGTLEDAINKGVRYPGFWQWGAGGSFKLIRQHDELVDFLKEGEKIMTEFKATMELTPDQVKQAVAEYITRNTDANVKADAVNLIASSELDERQMGNSGIPKFDKALIKLNLKVT